jgi:putative hemolysin
MIYLILFLISYTLHIAFALLGDALRFAQFGYIKLHLNKRYQQKEHFKQQTLKMEDYFEDEGQNLRELEWGYLIFMGLGLIFCLMGFYQNETFTLDQVAFTTTIYFAITLLITGIIVRGFSEPFAESILIFFYPFWRVWHNIITPLRLLQKGVKVLIQRVKGIEGEEEDLDEQKILDSMEDGKKAGVLEDSEQEMIENLIEFKDLDVAEIMTPRTDMSAVPVESSVEDVIQSMVENRFSRILVYQENRDHIIGFVHVRDLLPFWASNNTPPPLKSLIRDPYFVPETKQIRTLFQEFKSKHLHIAVVLDEYGGTAGLVTLEDILEEIVGDIVDEHQEDEEKTYEVVSENEFVVQAKMRINELEELLEIEIEENESYDSIGGLLIAHLGRIPAQGERGDIEQFQISYNVLEANERRIEKIHLKKLLPTLDE